MAAVPVSFPDLFFRQAERYRERTALRRKEFGVWNRISWNEYAEKVRETAAGLLALGFEKGQCVAILGDNRPEWLFCHLGAMTAGGVTCGVYPTSSPEQVAYVVGHSESRILFVENEEQVDKVLQIMDDISAEKVVVWDPKGLWGFTHERIMLFDDFLEQGRALMKERPKAVDERWKALEPHDTAMIIYTSGTTGRPKGAMISHENILEITKAFSDAVPTYDTDEVISYLPLAHIYENIMSLFQAIWAGGTVNFVESMDTLPQNLTEVSPTLFGSVPRIWEKFASMIAIRMSDSTPFKRLVYYAAVKTGMKYVKTGEGTWDRRKWSLLYWPMYYLVLYHLKRRIGMERIRWAICAAAPASPELFEFYNALGVPLREAYGQTESTGVIAVQRLDRPRWGFVGEPIEGMEVRIADDGEILCKGKGVFQGYFKAQALTEETVKDGWLHTGDVGALENGFLKIMDRKKDILITAAGKNITPAFIENKLKFSPYIQDAVVIGDGKKYITALILIDEDNVTKYAQDNRIPFTTFADLTSNPDIYELIDREVTNVNKTLSRVESVKKFKLLPRRFYEEDGDVTPTKKVKRRFLEERYADLIASMY